MPPVNALGRLGGSQRRPSLSLRNDLLVGHSLILGLLEVVNQRLSDGGEAPFIL